MTFYKDIEDLYGRNAVNTLKTWSNLRRKLTRWENRRNFLLTCRNEFLIPKHIKQNFNSVYDMMIFEHPYKNTVDRMVRSFQRKCLNMEIKLVFWRINKLNIEIRSVIQETNQLIPHIIIQNFIFCQDRVNNNLNMNQKRTLQKKIQQLRVSQNSISLLENKEWIDNTTEVRLPSEVSTILSLGPKFIAPFNFKKIPTMDILKDVEFIIQNKVPTDERDMKRSICTNIITNFINKPKYVEYERPVDKHITRSLSTTRRFFREHEELIVLRADKGNRTVVMYKEDYLRKIQALLNEENTYERLNKDPTLTLQKETNNLIKSLHSKKYINEEEKRNLIKNNCIPPKLYGVCKIHKEGAPLRPIVSCMNSPGFGVSKFLVDILKNLVPSFKYNIKNSFELVDHLRNVVIPENHVLVSFDVESLFTNIMKTLVVRLIEDSWHQISSFTNIDYETFLELVENSFNMSYLTFNDCFYKQISGCPMGAPCSPILANYVMNFVLEEVVEKVNFVFPILFLYVDDILTCVPKDSLNYVLEIFNSIDPKLKFTYELENANHELPFLDVLIIRDPINGHLKTNLYKKPTSTNRTINYFSLHPTYQKINIITQSKNRIERLCSEEFKSANVKKLKSDLMLNSYPRKLINKVLNVNNRRPNEIEREDTEVSVSYVKLPLVPGLSTQLSRVLKQDNQKIVLYNNSTLGKLVFSRLKDRTKKEYMSCVVYKISCEHCSKCYVGTTKQYLKNRISAHKTSVKNLSNNKTALVEHHLETGHFFNFNIDDVEILHQENNCKKRMIAEMINIKKEKSVNFRTDIEGLSRIYFGLIERL